MTVHHDSVLLQLYARAPAPSRDYYGLTITENWVILNIWNISYGPHVFPKRYKLTHADFSETKYLQNEVRRLFGQHVLHFALGLSRNERNLQYLPTKIFLYILRHLATNDILRLSQASKIFFDLCNSNDVWKIIYRKKIKKRPTYEDNRMAEDNVSWMDILKRKHTIKKTEKKQPIKSDQNTKLNNAILNQVKKKAQHPKNQFSSSTTNSLHEKSTVKDASKSLSNIKTASKSHSHLVNKPSSNVATKKNYISTLDINKGRGDFASVQRNITNKNIKINPTEITPGMLNITKKRETSEGLKKLLNLEANKSSPNKTATNKKVGINPNVMSEKDDVKQKIFKNLLKM